MNKIDKNLAQPATDRPKLTVPGGETDILLHSCCAPCAGDLMAELTRSEINYTILFYNPNIHPLKEYEIRKDENKRYADKLGVPFVDLDYNKEDWFDKVEGYEHEPERGYRCTLCFDMRFERSALYAAENGFRVFTSSLGTSRWKNLEQINGCGERAASRYDELVYWTFNWRKKGGANRMIDVSKQEKFYQQEYCGCAYSLRDTNQSRLERGMAPIKLGVKFYGDDVAD
ncbi:MAG: epoxyqueuosine reductase QueH [Rhodospirillaceae bacterium]|nr:epoxyqueuosine reductase QueH [Rhodospirillaceae bacterium]